MPNRITSFLDRRFVETALALGVRLLLGEARGHDDWPGEIGMRAEARKTSMHMA
jgi:hypothetical protein